MEIKYLLIFLTANFLSALVQVFLKKSAARQHASLLGEYLNPSVILSYAVLMGCTLLTTMAYRHTEFSLGPILEASSYIFVFLLSVMILHEKATLRLVLGNILIMSGIILYVSSAK